MAIGVLRPDGQNLWFANHAFDMVISYEASKLFPDALKALREILSVGRPGRKLLLTTPKYANFTALCEILHEFYNPARKDDQPFGLLQWYAQMQTNVRE